MKKSIILSTLVYFVLLNTGFASDSITKRIPQFTNDKVTVWETVVYPSKDQVLRMHRHDHDRVVVALNSGTLKVSNDKGKVHLMKLEKNKAYYLSKDMPGEMHTDENVSQHPIKVLVIELNAA